MAVQLPHSSLDMTPQQFAPKCFATTQIMCTLCCRSLVSLAFASSRRESSVRFACSCWTGCATNRRLSFGAIYCTSYTGQPGSWTVLTVLALFFAGTSLGACLRDERRAFKRCRYLRSLQYCNADAWELHKEAAVGFLALSFVIFKRSLSFDSSMDFEDVNIFDVMVKA